MAAPKTPNTEAARAVKAANARQRKIDSAVALLTEAGYAVLHPNAVPIEWTGRERRTPPG